MVSPWMKHGNVMQCISHLLKQKEKVPYYRWIYEIASGMQYLFHEDVVHGDLRGANILVDDKLSIQIADFGLSRVLDPDSAKEVSIQSGAVRWFAPEIVLHSAKASSRTEVYAFGCVCLEIFTRKIPFCTKCEYQVSAGMSNHQPPYSSLKALPAFLRRHIADCISFKSSKCPNIDAIVDLLQHVPYQLQGTANAPSVALSRVDVTAPQSSPQVPRSAATLIRDIFHL
ncbi:unnamed protein product [Somion occarium]|uniref:Protein kinase domain-containing protein n=1 Tax=Somion occarium TaxID=3059160 RepID=A0ABP1DTU4_9APHY